MEKYKQDLSCRWCQRDTLKNVATTAFGYDCTFCGTFVEFFPEEGGQIYTDTLYRIYRDEDAPVVRTCKFPTSATPFKMCGQAAQWKVTDNPQFVIDYCGSHALQVQEESNNRIVPVFHAPELVK
jgi:hypothetical protein